MSKYQIGSDPKTATIAKEIWANVERLAIDGRPDEAEDLLLAAIYSPNLALRAEFSALFTKYPF